jgi:hypothetical protein
MALTITQHLSKRWGVTGDPARDNFRVYRALRGFCVGDGIDLDVGQEIELPERFGRHWVASGRLELVGDVAPAPVDSADPVLDNADPTLTTRKTRKA